MSMWCLVICDDRVSTGFDVGSKVCSTIFLIVKFSAGNYFARRHSSSCSGFDWKFIQPQAYTVDDMNRYHLRDGIEVQITCITSGPFLD